MNIENTLLLRLNGYFSGDPRRIQHAAKVYLFASLIADGEHLDEKARKATVLAAIVHDVGIKVSEMKYGRCDGPLQEKEGPAEAEKLLAGLGLDDGIVTRISFLVGHHHTYTGVDGIDWQILLEADFIVNALEDGMPVQALESGLERIFRTETGKGIFRTMYSL